jgi:pimeloyl-ACP methyl ester carboxylesterase
MTNRRFEKIYRNAPRELVEELLEFRATHPPVTAEIGGVEWTYRCAGEGPESLLILPGATGDGEQPFRNITAWGRRYRVISVDYPPVWTMKGLADGLAGLLDREGVSKCHVVGGS